MRRCRIVELIVAAISLLLLVLIVMVLAGCSSRAWTPASVATVDAAAAHLDEQIQEQRDAVQKITTEAQENQAAMAAVDSDLAGYLLAQARASGDAAGLEALAGVVATANANARQAARLVSATLPAPQATVVPAPSWGEGLGKLAQAAGTGDWMLLLTTAMGLLFGGQQMKKRGRDKQERNQALADAEAARMEAIQACYLDPAKDHDKIEQVKARVTKAKKTS